MAKLAPLERRIEILKLLHGRKMRTSEIQDYFGLEDERTIRMDLEKLRDGLNVFGVKMKIESKHYDGIQEQYYKSTLHPIMLALNLSELLALLKLLETAGEEPLIGKVYKHIFDSVYSQITEYAERRLAGKLKNKHTKTEISNRLEEEAYEDCVDSKFLYWLKSGRFIAISYTDEDNRVINQKVRLVSIAGKELTIQDEQLNKRCINYDDFLIDWTAVEYK